MAKLKNVMPKMIIDGAIFNSLSDETLTEVGLTAYQLGLAWFKKSGEKSVNTLVEYFTKDGEITEEGTKILGQMFADKYSNNIHRLYLALSAEYNPIENYDRTENTTDTTTGKTTANSKGSNESNGTNTNNVSAFDSSEYQPESQNINNDKTTTETKGETESNETNIHEARIHGNIGITTNQQMINEELKLRIYNHIVEEILKWCDSEFCLKIYEQLTLTL